MHVVFVFDANNDRVQRVMWVDESEGCVMARVLLDDDTLVDRRVGCAGLRDAVVRYGGAYSPMYPAEVASLNAAFEFIGLNAELVEALPEAAVIDIPGMVPRWPWS